MSIKQKAKLIVLSTHLITGPVSANEVCSDLQCANQKITQLEEKLEKITNALVQLSDRHPIELNKDSSGKERLDLFESERLAGYGSHRLYENGNLVSDGDLTIYGHSYFGGAKGNARAAVVDDRFEVYDGSKSSIRLYNNGSIGMNGDFYTHANATVKKQLRVGPDESSLLKLDNHSMTFKDTGDAFKFKNFQGNDNHRMYPDGDMAHDGNLTVYKNTDIKGTLKVGGRQIVTDNGHLTISASQTFNAERHNSEGYSQTKMVKKNNSMCFLTKVRLEDADDAGEYAGCEVVQSGNSYYLRAYVNKNWDADAWCQARCISW